MTREPSIERTGAPIKPARRKPHIRLHYAATPPQTGAPHPWYATIHRSRATVPLAATPFCGESWRAVGAALGMLAYGA